MQQRAGEPANVVLKFMRNEDQCERELALRGGTAEEAAAAAPPAAGPGCGVSSGAACSIAPPPKSWAKCTTQVSEQCIG